MQNGAAAQQQRSSTQQQNASAHRRRRVAFEQGQKLLRGRAHGERALPILLPLLLLRVLLLLLLGHVNGWGTASDVFVI
jgi:hypothetical protein